MPRPLLRLRMFAGKQQSELSPPAGTQKPYRVVLVVLAKVLAMLRMPAFAEYVRNLPRRDRFELHPCLEPKRVADSKPHVRKTAAFVILDQQRAFMPGKGHRSIFGIKPRVSRRSRSILGLSKLPQPCPGLSRTIKLPDQHGLRRRGHTDGREEECRDQRNENLHQLLCQFITRELRQHKQINLFATVDVPAATQHCPAPSSLTAPKAYGFNRPTAYR